MGVSGQFPGVVAADDEAAEVVVDVGVEASRFHAVSAVMPVEHGGPQVGAFIMQAWRIGLLRVGGQADMVFQGFGDAVQRLQVGELDAGGNGHLGGAIDRTDGVLMIEVPVVCRSGEEGDASVGRIDVVFAVLPDGVHGADGHGSREDVGGVVGGCRNGDVAVAAVFCHIQGDHGVAGGQVVSLPAIDGFIGSKVSQDADFLSVSGVGDVQGGAVCHCRLACTIPGDRGFTADAGGIDDEHGVVGESDAVWRNSLRECRQRTIHDDGSIIGSIQCLGCLDGQGRR